MNDQEINDWCVSTATMIGYFYARRTPEEKYRIRQEFCGQELASMFDTIDQQAQQEQQQPQGPY